MGDADKYKKKYLALKKKMEGGVGSYLAGESIASSRTNLLQISMGTKGYQDLLICPIVIMTNTTDISANPIEIFTEGLNRWKSFAPVGKKDGEKVVTVTSAHNGQIGKWPSYVFTNTDGGENQGPLEYFMFDASLVNADLYRIIITNIMNPFIFENRLESFFERHKENVEEEAAAENHLNRMKQITRKFITNRDILSKFIFNSYNVVSLLELLEEDNSIIRDLKMTNAYKDVLKFFSISSFRVYNQQDAARTHSTRFTRHANHLLYYFGPCGTVYDHNYGIKKLSTGMAVFEKDVRYAFEVYPSEDASVDAAFLLAHNGKNTLKQLNGPTYRDVTFGDVDVNITGTTIDAGVLDYKNATDQQVMALFDLLSPGQKILVSFDKPIPLAPADGEIPEKTQVYIKRTKEEEKKFQVIKENGEAYNFNGAGVANPNPTQMTCIVETKKAE